MPKILYVGGIGTSIDEEQLVLAFNTFGYLTSVQLKDNHAFVEFEEEEDAKSAMDNMDGAEIKGKTITVNFAYSKSAIHGKAVWDAPDPSTNDDDNDS